jgi:hypothetical protein
MNKIICVLTFSLVITVSIFAQSNGPLHGKYNETSGTISLAGEQPKCWLYKLPPYMEFDDIVVELYEYLQNEMPLGEDRGWPIDWDNVEEINLKTDLANTIRTMMNRLKRNVSIFLQGYVNSSMAAPPSAAYISYYDSGTDVFTTLYVQFYR